MQRTELYCDSCRKMIVNGMYSHLSVNLRHVNELNGIIIKDKLVCKECRTKIISTLKDIGMLPKLEEKKND